jgi:hypothetical protein
MGVPVGDLRVMVYPKVSGLSVDNEINNNKHSLRSNRKGCGDKTHYADSQNSDTTASSGREQFSLQAANPETFGYTLACCQQFKLEGRNERTADSGLCFMFVYVLM